MLSPYKKVTEDNALGVLTEVDKLHRSYCQQTIVLNESTRRYQHYEMGRGEELLENIPVHPHNSYSIEDRINELERQKEHLANAVRTNLDSTVRAFQIRDKTAAYHEKKKKFEWDVFMRQMNEYPGGKLGNRPEDDMESFMDYCYKIMPRFVLDEVQDLKRYDELRSGVKEENLTEILHWTTLGRSLAKNRPITSK